MHWRWDQGRLDYFRFDTIKRIAKVLCSLENVDLRATADPLRERLTSHTGLPFAPNHYKVWRNYKRVFGCCLLASDIDGRMICTEICHRIASSGGDEIQADIYFGNFIKRFYYPSPTFEGYSNVGQQYFPVCAILKLLISRLRSGQKPEITIDEIVKLVVANKCTGEEPIDHYIALTPRDYTPAHDEVRQIRELVRFVSQISVLKWFQPSLFLDIDYGNSDALRQVEELAEPTRGIRNSDAARELLALGRTGDLRIVQMAPSFSGDSDRVFSEGEPKRISHLRYERSSKLREFFFSVKQPPFLCEMCSLNVTLRYPWVKNLLEVHHLLPLASPLRIDERRTSLSELVGLCPNCHRSTHLFYKRWLDENSKDDFSSYDEARDVYQLAKNSIHN